MHEVVEVPGSKGRVRVERWIYEQANGNYLVCFMLDGRPRFRTVGNDLELARAQRLSFMRAAQPAQHPAKRASSRRRRRRLAGGWRTAPVPRICRCFRYADFG
jgi:hypothetical protein